MTIHVNIAEAKARLSELVAAAVNGEEVILKRAGAPQVRLTPVSELADAEPDRAAAKRRRVFGMYRHLVRKPDEIDVDSLIGEDAEEERFRRKFGSPA